jgi:hypothetical protein
MIFIIMENEIIKSSKTISEAIKKIFGYDNGKTRKKFFDFVEVNEISISHLKKKISKYEKVIKFCPVCGKEFQTIINHRDEKTTCSYSCSNTHFRSGKSNPNWKDESYRTTCFEYHKKECIICGENKIVTVHHFDENRNNNSPENLIPLCPTHHHYVHSRYVDEVMDKIKDYRNIFLKSP